MTSGESTLIAEVIAKTNGSLSVAPNVLGEIALFDIGHEQFYTNDGAFLTMSSNADYHMSLQKAQQYVWWKHARIIHYENQKPRSSSY